MRKVIYLFIIVMLLSGCATMNETMESLIGHSPGATTLVVPTEQYVEMIYMPQPRMEGQGLMPYPYYFDGRYFYEQYNRYGHSLRQPQLHLTVPKLPPQYTGNGAILTYPIQGGGTIVVRQNTALMGGVMNGDAGYCGPSGEFYPNKPSNEMIKALYNN